MAGIRLIVLLVMLAAAVAAQAAADITVTPSGAQTLTRASGQSAFTSTNSNVWSINVHAKGSGTWKVFAFLNSHTGPETGASFTLGSVPSNFGSVASNGTTPAIQFGGSSPGTEIVHGTMGSANSQGVVATLGLTLTGVPTYARPGTYTGTVLFTMTDTDSGNQPSPNTATLSYSYTVSESGSIVVSPTSLAVADFSTSGGPPGSWVYTAALNKIATSIAAVQTSSSTLTIKAYVSSHTGPETSVKLNLASVAQGVYSSFSLTGGATPTIQIGGAGPGTQVASASTTTTVQSAATQVMTTGLIVTVPSTAQQGTYTGTITLTLGYGAATNTVTLDYSYTVTTYLDVSLDQGLFFHLTSPGVATAPSATTGYANPYATISATGNTAFHLNTDLSALIFAANTIPTTQLWLAIGSSATLANTAAGNAVTSSPSGLANIRYPATGTLAVGAYQLFLSGRIKTTTSNPPGTYSGTLTVTITAG